MLSGSFGEAARAPQISAFYLEDVDNGDESYGEGDELTIAFDRATDEAFLSTQARSSDEAQPNPHPQPNPQPNPQPALTLTLSPTLSPPSTYSLPSPEPWP